MTSPSEWAKKEKQEQIVKRFRELTKTESLKFLELIETVLESCSVPIDIAKEHSLTIKDIQPYA